MAFITNFNVQFFFFGWLFFWGRHATLCRDTEYWLTNPAAYIRVWRMYWRRILYCCVFCVIIQINIWCNNTFELKTGKNVNRFDIALKMDFFNLGSCLFLKLYRCRDCNREKRQMKVILIDPHCTMRT